MATIKDIAKAAGVSQGTVSNVLNGRDNVSSDKIERVMNAAKQMGYTINEKAQNLRKGATKTLAAVVPNLSDEPYSDFISHYKQYAEGEGYWVDLYTTGDNPDDERKLIPHLRSRMTEGVAVYPAIFEENSSYIEAGFAKEDVLYIEREQAFESLYLGVDMAAAGRQMAERAAAKGYQSVGVLLDSLNHGYKNQFQSVFCETLQSLNPQCRIYVRKTTNSCKYKNAVRIFAEIKPDAVFTVNVSLAKTIRNVYQSFYRKLAVDIYTISSNSFLPEEEFIKYEVDYKLLGRTAARRLIHRDEPWPARQILTAKGIYDWPVRVPEPDGKTLMVLSLASPTTRALQSMVNLYEDTYGTRVCLAEVTTESLYMMLGSWDQELPYDIIRMDVDWFPWFGKEVFEPLGRIDAGIAGKMGSLVPAVLEKYARIGADYYAFPGTPSVQLLFYRKDLFEDTKLKRLYYEKYRKVLQPPATFAEYNRIASFFTRSYNPESPVRYGTTLVDGELDVAGVEFLIRLYSHTRSLFNEQGEIVLGDEVARLAMEELAEAKRYSSGQKYTWWTEAAEEFLHGDAAMSVQFINQVSDFVGPDSVVSDKIGWTQVPGGNPIFGGSVLGISRHSAQKREALAFLEWMNKDEIATAITLLGGMSASKASYENTEVIDSYPWLSFARDCFAGLKGGSQQEGSKHNVEIRRLQNILGVAVKEVLGENLSVEQALKFAKTSYEKGNIGK